MKHTLACLLALVAITLVTPQVSHASYGGSGGYQAEAREDDYNLGGGCYNNPCRGRCGPGCSTAFGTVWTQACQNHDDCIRYQRCNLGKGKLGSHAACLTGSGGLGRAAASLIQYHFRNSPTNYVSDVEPQTPWACVGC